MDVLTGLETLFVVAAVSAAAPIIAVLLPGQRIPQLILLILGGVLIGPQVLGLEVSPEIELIANVGLGLVFLLAGFEIDPAMLFDRPGRLAVIAWLASAVVAAAVVGRPDRGGVRQRVHGRRPRPDHDRTRHGAPHPAGEGHARRCAGEVLPRLGGHR